MTEKPDKGPLGHAFQPCDQRKDGCHHRHDLTPEDCHFWNGIRYCRKIASAHKAEEHGQKTLGQEWQEAMAWSWRPLHAAAWRTILWCRRAAAGLHPIEPGLTKLIEEMASVAGDCPPDVAKRFQPAHKAEEPAPVTVASVFGGAADKQDDDFAAEAPEPADKTGASARAKEWLDARWAERDGVKVPIVFDSSVHESLTALLRAAEAAARKEALEDAARLCGNHFAVDYDSRERLQSDILELPRRARGGRQ